MIQLALLCESAQICVCVHHGADCVHWDGGPECRWGKSLREGERERKGEFSEVQHTSERERGREREREIYRQSCTCGLAYMSIMQSWSVTISL